MKSRYVAFCALLYALVLVSCGGKEEIASSDCSIFLERQRFDTQLVYLKNLLSEYRETYDSSVVLRHDWQDFNFAALESYASYETLYGKESVYLGNMEDENGVFNKVYYCKIDRSWMWATALFLVKMKEGEVVSFSGFTYHNLKHVKMNQLIQYVPVNDVLEYDFPNSMRSGLSSVEHKSQLIIDFMNRKALIEMSFPDIYVNGRSLRDILLTSSYPIVFDSIPVSYGP